MEGDVIILGIYILDSLKRFGVCVGLILGMPSSASANYYGFGPIITRTVPSSGASRIPEIRITVLTPPIKDLLSAEDMSVAVAVEIGLPSLIPHITTVMPTGEAPMAIADGRLTNRDNMLGVIGCGEPICFHCDLCSVPTTCRANMNASPSSLRNQISIGAVGLLSSSLKKTSSSISRGPICFRNLAVSSWASEAFWLASAARAFASAIVSSEIRCNSAAAAPALWSKWISNPTPAAITKVANIAHPVSIHDLSVENKSKTTMSSAKPATIAHADIAARWPFTRKEFLRDTILSIGWISPYLHFELRRRKRRAFGLAALVFSLFILIRVLFK